MKSACNLASMNGCHDLGNDCVIIIFIIFVFSRLVAGAYFFIFYLCSGQWQGPLFAAFIFYYYFDVGRLVEEGFYLM